MSRDGTQLCTGMLSAVSCDAAARESMFMKMYAQMMQQMTGQGPHTSASSEDPLVVPTFSGTVPESSARIPANRPNAGYPEPGKKGSSKLKNKLMMTNPLASGTFNRGGLPDEATGEEEGSGALQSGSMQLTPYMSGNNGLYDSGNGYSQTDMQQQQIMAESLRPGYGTAADPDRNLAGSIQGKRLRSRATGTLTCWQQTLALRSLTSTSNLISPVGLELGNLAPATLPWRRMQPISRSLRNKSRASSNRDLLKMHCLLSSLGSWDW